MRQKYLKVLISLATILVMVMLLFLFSPMGLVQANPGLDIIATGLNNPRGIESGPDGMLYVAEAGTGGPSENGNCGFNPGGEGDRCYGETGGITRVDISGTNQTRIISDMVSLADPMAFGVGPAAATGPHDVAFDGDGDMYVTVGWGGDPISRTTEFGPVGANFGQLAHVFEVMTGTGVYSFTNVIDIAQYEADNNPDGGPPDSNPFGIAEDPPDGFAVADAGANAMFQMDQDTMVVSTLAVFPNRPVMFMTNTIPMHAVPTEVVVQSDGSYIVGQLTGFPFPPNLGWVFDVPDGGGEPTTREISFTHPIDVVYDDASGYLYVLQMDDDGLFFGENLTGSVIQVMPSGARVVLESSLGLPVGMTMGSDGALYVTACMQTIPIPEPCLPEMGVVVRIEPFVPTDVSLSSLDGGTSSLFTPLVLLLSLVVLIPAMALVLRRRNAVN